jgi:hypothetical protein
MEPKRSTMGRPRAHTEPESPSPTSLDLAEPIEPVEPGGEVGATREVAAGGSAERLPGRPPRTRVVMHDEDDAA